MLTFKVKTNLSEFLVESETYELNGTTAVFFDGMMATNIIKGVVSVEPTCKFKVGDEVNCRSVNGIVTSIGTTIQVDFGGGDSLVFELVGVRRAYPHVKLELGHCEPTFKLHDRVEYKQQKGVVTEMKGGIYPVRVLLDGGRFNNFTPDGRFALNEEPTLSLVTPNWTGLELKYYNALIKAGASESAADYAVTKTLTGNYGIVTDFRTVLAGNFAWGQTPWGNEYWETIHTAIETPPSVKLQQLLSDKTPEIGDLVIAGDGTDDFYYVGVYIKNDGDSYPYLVEKVGNECAEWFKNIKCLNL